MSMMIERENVNEIKSKLKQEFGVVEDGKLRKVLGVRYEWGRNDNGEPFATLSMADKAQTIIDNYVN